MPKVIGYDPVDLGYGGMINYSGSDNNKVLDDVKDGDYPRIPGEAGTAYRYLRWSSLTSTYLQLLDLRFNDGVTPYPSNMTSDTSPSPLIASADTYYSIYRPWRAFSADTSSVRWIANGSAPHWIQIDLGVGNEIAPTGYTAKLNTVAGSPPDSIQVIGSNTGDFTGEEEVIYSVTGDSGNFTYGVSRTVTF